MTGIDNRKDLILLLLYAPGAGGEECAPIRGRTRLMKLLFLLGQDKHIPDTLGIREWYSFQPYDYGPYTHEVFNDVEFLRNVGLIEGTAAGPLSIAETRESEYALDEGTGAAGADFPEDGLPEEVFRLSAKGRAFVERNLNSWLTPTARETIEGVKAKEGSLSLSSLLRYVYSRFPDSASKTKLDYLRP